MKPLILLLLCLAISACTTAPKASVADLRSDVLYFQNTILGREEAQRILDLFGGRQKAAIVDGDLPKETPPKPVYREKPLYPYEMRNEHKEGAVTVEFIVGENGQVLDATAIQATYNDFAQMAVNSVLAWKFKPAMRQGKPVRCDLQVDIYFTLNET